MTEKQAKSKATKLSMKLGKHFAAIKLSKDVHIVRHEPFLVCKAIDSKEWAVATPLKRNK